MVFEHFDPTDEKQSCVVRTMTKLTGRDYGSVKAVYKKTTDRKEHHHEWEYCKTPAFGRSGGGAGN